LGGRHSFGGADSVSIILPCGNSAVVTVAAASDSLRAGWSSGTDSIRRRSRCSGHPLPNVEVLFATTIGNITPSRTTNTLGMATVPFSSVTDRNRPDSGNRGNGTGSYTLYLIPRRSNSINSRNSPGSVGVRAVARNEYLAGDGHSLRDVNNNPVIDGTEVYFNIT